MQGYGFRVRRRARWFTSAYAAPPAPPPSFQAHRRPRGAANCHTDGRVPPSGAYQRRRSLPRRRQCRRARPGTQARYTSRGRRRRRLVNVSCHSSASDSGCAAAGGGVACTAVETTSGGGSVGGCSCDCSAARQRPARSPTAQSRPPVSPAHPDAALVEQASSHGRGAAVAHTPPSRPDPEPAAVLAHRRSLLLPS
jgi:hypothetical protein